MRNSFILFIIGTLLSFFYLFEKDMMFAGGGADIVESSGHSTLYVILMIAICLVVIFAYRENSIKENTITKRISQLMLILYLISVFFSLFNPFPARMYYGLIILPLLLYYFIYFVTTYINNSVFPLWGFTIVVILLAMFYFTNYYENVLYDITHQSNASYSVLYFLPFMLCHKNKWLKIFFVFLTFTAILFSLKRGGFFAFLFALAIYLFIEEFLVTKRNNKLKGLFIIVIAVFSISYLIAEFNQSNEGILSDRIDTMVGTGGSGRMDIYESKLELISESSPVGFLFGHGYLSTQNDDPRIKLTAHNDFLEVLYDFGCVTLIFFILLYVSLIKHCKLMIVNKSRFAAPLACSIAIFFVNSMVAHIVIYFHYMMIFALFWGYLLAADKIEQQKNTL